MKMIFIYCISQIPLDALKMVKRIGEGANGVVYEAGYGAEKVAVKTLMAGYSGFSNEELTELASEGQVVAALNHPNVLRFIGISMDFRDAGDGQRSELKLVWEYCSMGGLDEVIQKKRSKLSASIKFKIAREITAGMAFLHEHNVLHRDLKPGNVFLNNEGSKFACKVGDFGTSRNVKGVDEAGTKTGDIGSPGTVRQRLNSRSTTVFMLPYFFYSLSVHGPRTHPGEGSSLQCKCGRFFFWNDLVVCGHMPKALRKPEMFEFDTPAGENPERIAANYTRVHEPCTC